MQNGFRWIGQLLKRRALPIARRQADKWRLVDERARLERLRRTQLEESRRQARIQRETEERARLEEMRRTQLEEQRRQARIERERQQPVPPVPRPTTGSEQARRLPQTQRQVFEQAGYEPHEAARLAAVKAQERAVQPAPLIGGRAYGVPGGLSQAQRARAALRIQEGDFEARPARVIQRRTSRYTGPEYYRGGSEQAYLGPVAQAEAFFTGSQGERWQLGAFYRGIAPEERDPPAFLSQATYRILTEGTDERYRVPVELVDQLYEQDPTTGHYVLRYGEPAPPISGGYGDYGFPSYAGYPGFSYPSYSYDGYDYVRSFGLVTWRI